MVEPETVPYSLFRTTTLLIFSQNTFVFRSPRKEIMNSRFADIIAKWNLFSH